MSLAVGTRLGPYEVISPIGSGGMGEVYKARDTRLDRAVAIKVLPETLAADPQFRERFEREARAIAALTHPHICTLHDVGRQDNIEYLVMELLDGETLEARLRKGAVPIDQALTIAIEIVSALDKAHRAGIVHRDLKPGNVMLTKMGVKLLDFGLAKTVPVVAPAGGFSMLPTTPPVAATAQGTILGTFQYMAPEQLEGHEADARADIFAFGAVLYEMVTGKRAFEAKSQASLIAAIMHAEPPVPSTLQPVAPVALDRLVGTCLAKDPDDRWQTARDLQRELTWIAGSKGKDASSSNADPEKPRVSTGRERLAWAFGAVMSLVALGLAVRAILPRQTTSDAPVYRSTIVPSVPTIASPPARFAISPDGKRIALATGGPGQPLRVRSLDGLTDQPLVGTEGARAPFWSPDSSAIAFWADNSIRRISASGGPVLTLAESTLTTSPGAWSRDNMIFFAPSRSTPLFAVPAAGGTPKRLTTLDVQAGETQHAFPAFLPDGRFLYTAFAGNRPLGVYVGSLDSPERTRVMEGGSNVASVQGSLFFVRGTTLVVQPFDARTLTLSGEAVPVAAPIRVSNAAALGGAFSVSENGTLVYQGGVTGEASELVWFDRSGQRLDAVGTRGGAPSFVQLAPDGARVAVGYTGESGQRDIWLLDTLRGGRTRFTAKQGEATFPAWSPDGRALFFSAQRNGRVGLYQRSSDGGGTDELLFADDAVKRPTGVSPDGRFLLYAVEGGTTNRDIWALPLSGDRKPFPLVQTPFLEDSGQVSPDGRWLAYSSNETGRNEVYVVPFMRSGGRVSISTAGGEQPRWRRDGKEIFFKSGTHVMAISVAVQADRVTVGEGKPLVEARILGSSDGYEYDVSGDGQKLLVVKDPEEALLESAYTLVVNWRALLKR